jgi:hypothetical protein
MENDWILPSRQYAHLQMAMKHCTKAGVCPMSHIGGEFCDRQTDGQTDRRTDGRTESTKTICLPLEEGRHKKTHPFEIDQDMFNIICPKPNSQRIPCIHISYKLCPLPSILWLNWKSLSADYHLWWSFYWPLSSYRQLSNFYIDTCCFSSTEIHSS